MKGVKISQLDATTGLRAAGRRDLYTISLLIGPCHLPYADGEIERDGTYLLVGKPDEVVPSSRGGSTPQTGYSCLFTAEFLEQCSQAGYQPSWAVFTGNPASVISLGREQAASLTTLFRKMLAEQESAYHFKHELLGNYLRLLLHEALRLRQPAPKRYFQYYVQRPGSANGLGSGWGSRRKGA